MNISEKAKEYAEGKVIEAYTSIVEKAYREGYKAGYNDALVGTKPEDIDDVVEFVDLGLPSRTMWAIGYLKDKGGKIQYYTYEEASKMRIPTKEQFEELVSCCKKGLLNEIIGNNGNKVRYTGYKKLSRYYKHYNPTFWLVNDENEDLYRPTADLVNSKVKYERKEHELPVVLVK